MGKGSYLGGHTIVGARSGWFSGGRDQSWRDERDHEKYLQEQENEAVELPLSLTLKSARLETLRLCYLSNLLDAHLRLHPLPRPPKEARNYFVTATTEAGGPLKWAEMQPEYLKFKKRKAKKLMRQK